MFAFCLGTVCDKELARGDSAVVAVVSVPHCTQNCGDTEVAEPWGCFSCLKADAGCLFPVTHMDWGEGGQTCSSMLWISPVPALLSFGCRLLWQTLGSCVLLILSACVPPTSVQTFACKTEFFLKTGILPAVCWLPYCALVLCRAVPQSWALSLIHPHCSRGEELPWHQNHRTWGKNRI